jgi:cysteine desulfurase
MTYLDYNASAPVRPVVIDAMREALGRTGNPSSVHGFGRRARHALEEARESIAALAGVAPDRVILTSGGTEANNQALRSIAGPCTVSAVEHDSVLGAVPEALRLQVDGAGRIVLDGLTEQLERFRPAMVSLMLANNETGVLQPVGEVAEIAGRYGALMHCDAVQAAGKVPLDMGRLGVDLLSLSAHKLGGPPGIGALVVRDGIDPVPLLRGGGQERRWRAGTENLSGAIGFGLACRLALEDTSFSARVGALRDELEARILKVAPAARVFGRDAARLCNTSCLAMPGVANQTQLMAFDLEGIAVSTGSACSSGKVGPSHVLAAMGVPEAEASSAIRVSLGWASKAADVDRFVEAWTRLFLRTRGGKERLSASA